MIPLNEFKICENREQNPSDTKWWCQQSRFVRIRCLLNENGTNDSNKFELQISRNMKNNGILCLYGNGLRSVKIDKHFSFKPKILNKEKIFTNKFYIHVFPEGIQLFYISSVIKIVFWSRKMWTKRIHLYTVQLKFCICFYCKSNST